MASLLILKPSEHWPGCGLHAKHIGSLASDEMVVKLGELLQEEAEDSVIVVEMLLLLYCSF